MQQTFTRWLQTCRLPKSEARLLLQYAVGCTHAQLITRGQEVLPTAAKAVADTWAIRRLRGEPMAYILGEREFYGRSFQVNPQVLIPRPETEHLVEAALEWLPNKGSIWDLGTGSGIIALTIALERPDARVRASDISPQALHIAAANALKLGVDIELVCGSWFAPVLPSDKKAYDIIVSNPPYIKANDHHLSQGDLRFEPQNALTDFADGLSCIRILTQEAGSYLRCGGWLIIEHGYNQGAAVRTLFEQNGFDNITTKRDLAGLERLTLGCLKT